MKLALNRYGWLFATALLTFGAAFAPAQTSLGNVAPTHFRDTGVLVRSEQELLAAKDQPRVAIVEFEDLECPLCAHVAPTVAGALTHYKIAFLRHDFLIPGHVWSRQGAITARYLEDKKSPELAEQYRRDVFANQQAIATPDDLQTFTTRWFDAHGKIGLPTFIDPSGRFAAEVQADITTGERLGVLHTPTIVVIGPRGWIEVTQIGQLDRAINQALAQPPLPPATATAGKAHPATR